MPGICFLSKHVLPSTRLTSALLWNTRLQSGMKLLDRLQKKALRLLRIEEPLKAGIVPLEHRRNVASLCVFYRHFFLQPSTELSNIIPNKVTSTRATRSSVSRHPFAVRIPRSNTELHLNSYIPTMSRLWNSLPASVFPSSPNIDAFKTAANAFLLHQNF